jgi:peptidyl-Lys metalloendopeptidase
MLAPATRIVLTSLVFSTSFAAPMLSLHVSGPEIVEGIENLKLVVTVTNVGDETLDLLKDPRSPLSNSLPTDKFGIINRAGVMPSFNGIVTKYNPSEAALVQSEGAFIVLAPGDFVDIEHNCMYSRDRVYAALT